MRSVPLNPWLQHLRQHLPIARAGQDPEGVHQVRVAGRRLRVWLRLAGMRTLDDDLAWLVRSAGEVRDLEVLLQTEFPQAFREWAQSRLNTAREKLLPVLESKRLEGLLQALSLLPPLGIADAEPRLGRFFAQVERRAALWSQEERFDVLHALRRALRRLRYALSGWGRKAEPSSRSREFWTGRRPAPHPGLPPAVRKPRRPPSQRLPAEKGDGPSQSPPGGQKPLEEGHRRA